MRCGSTGHTENERRDYGRRADCPCRLMKRLLAVEHGLSAEELADSRMSFEVARRILRQFAMKGFVRRECDRWVATPLLIRSSHVALAEGSP